ncbi:MAG: HEPN domain-containing protein [Holophagales bacterium]|jgi:HEPN domain-containing protein|nr:HEPN domain-containing protein [Holophagales bacterium]
MAMSAQEKYEYWLDAAQYDLETAKAMLDGGRWLYVAFMCQQAVEKLVKRLYILYLDDNVPRTHSIETVLGNFSDKLPIEIPPETLDFFATLSSCYLIPTCNQKIACRYEAAGTDARKFLKKLGSPVFQKLWRTAFNAS